MRDKRTALKVAEKRLQWNGGGESRNAEMGKLNREWNEFCELGSRGVDSGERGIGLDCQKI